MLNYIKNYEKKKNCRILNHSFYMYIVHNIFLKIFVVTILFCSNKINIKTVLINFQITL